MRILVTIVLMTLTGCTTSPIFRSVSSEAVEGYRAANTDAADFSEAVMCRGISIREWMLRYGATPDKARAWAVLCSDNMDITPRGLIEAGQ